MSIPTRGELAEMVLDLQKRVEKLEKALAKKKKEKNIPRPLPPEEYIGTVG